MKTFISGILLSIATFLTPIMGFMGLIGFLVFSDTAFAMYVAYVDKNGKKMENLTSNKFFNIAPKLFFYLGSIIMAYGCDYLFLAGGAFLGVTLFGTKMTTGAFIANEIKSINETYIKRFNKSIYDTLKEYYDVLKRLKKDIAELLDGEDKK
jgi:hypothetical protein